MKKKELASLREKDAKDLMDLASKKREEISHAYVDIISGKEKNTRKMRNLRHELAQILTIKTIVEKNTKEEKSKKTK